jgi:hypothetical protein
MDLFCRRLRLLNRQRLVCKRSVGGYSRERKADNYAAAASNLDWSGAADVDCRWPVFVMVDVLSGCCRWRGGARSLGVASFDLVLFGGILLYFRFISYVELGTSLCIYVDCT